MAATKQSESRSPGRKRSASRTELLLEGQTRVLERLATGASREEVLTELVRTIELCAPGMLCSVLLYDPASRCLRHGAAPSLPKAYSAAIDGLSIGPAVGSCGTAVYRKDRVIVEDISKDLLWADYRKIGLKHNLRACWSQPVLSSSGGVLGTFAMYYDHPRGPDREELELIEHAAHIAGVTIERTRADEALRESEARFRQLAESVRLIPWEADPETWRFTYVGPQAVEILGYSLDAWYMEDFWIDHVHPDDRARVAELRRERSKTDEPYECEYRMIASDGRSVWFHDVVRVIPRGEGRILGGFLIDVSEEKRAEETVRQADRLASVGTLAAGIAHEVNNPLAAILLASQAALSLESKRDANPRMTESLELIRDNAERCGRIVSGVLKFSRRGEAAFEPADVNEVVHSAANLVRSYARAKGAEMTEDLGTNLPRARMNRVEIEQVLVNLIRNAIESGSEGIHVEVRTRSAPGSIEFSVTDDGSGMTEEQKAHLFDPFYTTKRSDGGTGLGLSIVHGIVAMHGGTIDVDSAEGEGSTVTVRLPARGR